VRTAEAEGAGTQRIAGLEERIAAEVQELTRRARGRISPGPAGVRYLFVCGCPRSGTTALTTLLNEDERVLLGQERFRLIRKLLEPFHFTEEVFFNPTERETSWAMPWRGERVRPGSFAEYHALRERWRGGTVEVIGDKAPFYSDQLERLGSAFPGARFVLLVRDLHEVAASYRRRAADPVDHWPAENGHALATEHWNAALGHARAFPEADRLLLVSHARFFGGTPGELDRLYAFLGLEPEVAMRERHAAMVEDAEVRRTRVRPLPPPVAAAVDAARDRDLDAWAARATVS